MPLAYPADVTADTNGQWLVTFPDVPEAITSGDSRDDAIAHAADALATAFEFYAEAGKDHPMPSRTRPGQALVEAPRSAACAR